MRPPAPSAKNFDTSTAQLTAAVTTCIPLTPGGRLLLEAFCQMPTTFTLAGGVGYHIVQGSRARRDARPHLEVTSSACLNVNVR
jgi:hypothetical protein